MLFPYTYVPHKIEKMQEFIDFIFFEVWCKAPIGLVFHPNLFEGNLDLKAIMSEFGFSPRAPKRGKRFYKNVQIIYRLFAPLSALEIDQFREWYRGNNDIEKVCANDPSVKIARYADISTNHKEISEQLAIFFKDLYSPLLKLSYLRSKIGEVDDHYQTFMTANKKGKCPFCGVNDILGANHKKREAYDHYLPKALYPFNSINFKNLVPACHHCNSNYKTSQNPAHRPKDPIGTAQRRAVFYPYTAERYTIEVQVSLQHSDIANLTPADIDLQFGPAILNEKIETWKDVYDIEERYKAKFCGDLDGKYWFVQIWDEWKKDGKKPTDFMKTLERETNDYPYAECNFLKKPFLEACQKTGVLE